MIPAFSTNRTLPPGIHIATMEEFTARFAYNLKRKELLKKLIQFIDQIKTIGCKAIYIDGSYVTNKLIPGDIDICWENTGINLQIAFQKMPILYNKNAMKLLYGFDVFPANIMEESSGRLFIDFFQKDKLTDLPKGIIKILI
jgi:hypothetical protein